MEVAKAGEPPTQSTLASVLTTACHQIPGGQLLPTLEKQGVILASGPTVGQRPCGGGLPFPFFRSGMGLVGKAS